MWETGNPFPKETLCYVPAEHIKPFFELIKSEPPNKYTIVSASSDIGLAYQQEQPVWADMQRWLGMLDYRGLGYDDFHQHARCYRERCDINDRYSLKCWSWTFATFPEIPGSVKKWFMVNSLVEHPKIETIPFGIAENTAATLLNFPKQERDSWLYINHQNYTVPRVQLKKFYMAARHTWVTCRPESNLPFEEYLKELDSHIFCLCPNGNGIDCYRTAECLYRGVIPIVEDNLVTRSFQDLPMVRVANLFNITFDFLKEQLEYIRSQRWDLTRTTLSYWRNRIASFA